MLEVFAIVAIQLVVVTGLIALFVFNDDAGMWVKANRWCYYLRSPCSPTTRAL